MKKRRLSLNHLAAIILSLSVIQFSCNKDDKDGKVKDADGNSYTTVQIGEQTWMAENLRTTKLNDGTAIANVTDNSKWATLTTPAYCWYDNQSSNKEVYGALYNWFTVETGKLCPEGWRVANDNDWVKMELGLGLHTLEVDFLGWRGEENNVGGKLKETGTAHWKSPNSGATNETGFAARPGGQRSLNGEFEYLNEYHYWWLSVPPDDAYGFSRGVGYNVVTIFKSKFIRTMGFGVRCIKE